MKRLKSIVLVSAATLPLLIQGQDAKDATMGAKVGAPAPTIRLNNTDGIPVQVASPDRWSLLAFFPKAATPG